MIKREHIKQAIEAIAGRNPEIGYTLDEMLAVGRIDTLSPEKVSEYNGDFYLLFDNEPITIKRFIFFHEGTVPIEQRLLIKYGQMLKSRELQQKGAEIAYEDAVRELRLAGLKLMVLHEIDYAITRLQKGIAKAQAPIKNDLISRLKAVKRDYLPLKINPSAKKIDSYPDVLFCSLVDADTPAYFIRFPFSMDTLMQVADINLEFFQVRFLLNCLIRGTQQNLFACVADDKIEGMVYLSPKERYVYKALEIRYIATLRGAAADHSAYRPKVLKGVGTFLVAGVWLLWKTAWSGARDILLDSEIGARRFYDRIGFRSRGFSEYRLKAPEGHLVKTVLDMAAQSRDLNENVVVEIKKIIKNQVRILSRKAPGKKKKEIRKAALEAVQTCLAPGAHPQFAALAVKELIRNREKIPESRTLFRFAREHGSDETRRRLDLF